MTFEATAHSYRALGISGLANISDFFKKQGFNKSLQNGIIQGSDTAACLMINGKVIAATAQERFNAEKKTTAFPYDAIDFCLDAAQITFAELSVINFGFKFDNKFLDYNTVGNEYFIQCLSLDACIRMLRARYGSNLPKVHAFDHHFCHFYAASVTAPEEDALGLIFDAAAEKHSLTVYDYRSSKVKILERWPLTASLECFTL